MNIGDQKINEFLDALPIKQFMKQKGVWKEVCVDVENDILKYCYLKPENPNFIYDLDFENFTNKPEVESKKLLKFCGLPWDKKCLEFYKRKDLISRTASNVQIKEPIYKDSLNKYLPYKKFLNKYGKKYSWFN